MNYKMIGYVLGWILIFEGLFMTVPSVTAAIYGEPALWSYLIVMSGCMLVGGIIVMRKPQDRRLYAREGWVIVALSWIVLSIFGAIPLVLTKEIPNYIDALFEIVSGFSTTGASILSDVEVLSHASLMWRCFTNWIGGMGVLVFMMALLPLAGAQDMHLMKAESPGPSVSKLVPRVKTTALLLYSIYLVLTLIEFIMLLFGRMTVFEALATTFSTAGTGGFGIYNSGVGSFSPYIQIVITVFMILFATNFNSFFFIITGRLKEAFTTEVRTYLLIIVSATAIITLNIYHLFGNLSDALRSSAFTVASIMSSTGFYVSDFNEWPELSRTLIIIMMLIGSCAGSTGCGMKVSRVIILFKGMAKELQTMVQPRRIKKIKMDSHIIGHETVRSVNVYIVAYILIFMISATLISFDNRDLLTTFTSVAAMLNNTGPGLGSVGPTGNYGFFSAQSKFILIFDMLAGRLELFPMLILLTPETWKK